ncbi:hypothetical protein Tco_1068328 [Tanacetum coccineum]|uniref:Uncharacterized protein n=1 Tax=Tanacetum coccineum TaxID=301880 RepID=A0ABQ5HFD4_9ASTR
MCPSLVGPNNTSMQIAVHKELGDNLVRAATTASSLEPKHDSGGPKCQETMGDTIAQTRFENVSKLSKDSLLARCNTLRSDEDKLKLNELMELYEDITLVNDDADKEMFDVDALNGEEVFVAWQNENVVEEIVDAAQVSTEEITLAQALADLKSTKPKAKGIAFREIEPEKPLKKKDQLKLDEDIALKLQAKIEVDHELAQRLQVEEQEELSVEEKAKLFQQLLEKKRKHFEGKKLKDLKNKSFDSIQKMFDRAFKRVNTFVDF